MNKFSYFFTLFLCLLAASFLLCQTSHASGLNFSVQTVTPENQIDKTKTYFDLKVTKKSQQTLAIKLKNLTDKELTITPSVHSATTNTNGVIEYSDVSAKPAKSLTYDLASLTEYPAEIILPAKATRTLKIALSTPKNNFDGIIAGGITLQESVTTDDGPATQTESAIKNRYAYVVVVILQQNESQVNSELILNSVQPAIFEGDSIINATIENTKGKYMSPLTMATKITKKGSLTVLFQQENKEVRIAPNSLFNFTTPFQSNQEVSVEPGYYTIHLSATDAVDKWDWSEDFFISSSLAKMINNRNSAHPTVAKRSYQTLAFILAVTVISLGCFSLVIIKVVSK